MTFLDSKLKTTTIYVIITYLVTHRATLVVASAFLPKILERGTQFEQLVQL